jgi:hypothetical protein
MYIQETIGIIWLLLKKESYVKFSNTSHISRIVSNLRQVTGIRSEKTSILVLRNQATPFSMSAFKQLNVPEENLHTGPSGLTFNL